MSTDTPTASFERKTAFDAASPTLIEGLPGLGMVASIAVDQITTQLDLDHHGSIQSAALPSVAAFADGRVRDMVRVYAGADPPVMTLQSDIPIPPNAAAALSRTVYQDLAEEFERAVFLAGAPAESEAQLGEVVGVATSDETEAELRDAGIELAEESGSIGGITGALVADCYAHDVPASVLIVRCDPRLPDPNAAQSVIENALEPLVDFDIDTSELEEQAQQIQQQKQQIAKQLQQLRQQQQEEGETLQSRAMYQ
ncbi:proteasome assembly chaperone family protein [Haloglomus salinum]|uniref:proteasome assembly chaperone family protein n=1 Tax=Haloglomus salinum TaxID=2962673 RepID=UPI0020C9B619|nr:PAC2 family protein [Haloglomus salinum]